MRAHSKGVLAEPNNFLAFGLFNDPLSVSWMEEEHQGQWQTSELVTSGLRVEADVMQ